jgi:hypothetical protein
LHPWRGQDFAKHALPADASSLVLSGLNYMQPFTKNVVVECPTKIVKICWISFQKNGDISVGLVDKSIWSDQSKITYHHGYQRGGQRSPDIDWIHIKDRRTGKVVAEGITAFNSEMVTDEWMWCEVIWAPLSAIESGAIRSYRTRDKILALKAETEDFSVRAV